MWRNFPFTFLRIQLFGKFVNNVSLENKPQKLKEVHFCNYMLGPRNLLLIAKVTQNKYIKHDYLHSFVFTNLLKMKLSFWDSCFLFSFNFCDVIFEPNHFFQGATNLN